MANEPWADVPVVEHVVYLPPDPPPCPHCGSDQRPHLIRTEQNGDDSATRKCVCRDCAERFKISINYVAASPGNSLDEDAYDD